MPTDLSTIYKLSVPIIVRMGEAQMCVEDVISLGPGAILELTKTADEDLDLLVNNRCIGKGVAVKVGENFGLQITQIGTAHERVEALSGGDADDSE